jgi:hypothetical protein
MPLQEHEYFKEIISLLVQDLADELGLLRMSRLNDLEKKRPFSRSGT